MDDMPAERNQPHHQTTNCSSSLSSSTASTISNSSATSESIDQELLPLPPHQTTHKKVNPTEPASTDQNDSLVKIKIKSRRFVSRPLQRNQACSTCRSRKVRCDAQKPACGACKRSAAAHGENPSIVVCQYDVDENNQDETIHSDVNHQLDPTIPPIQKPLAKIAALEKKIAEMENLISRLNLSLNHPPTSSTCCSGPSLSSISTPCSNVFIPSIPNCAPTPMEVVWTNWPTCLPPRRIISHLVKLYFSLQSGAGQLMFLEPAQLLASLHLPPNHPDFPFVGLLHSIMAVAYQQSVLGNPDRFALNLLRVCNIKRYWPMDSVVHHYHAKCAKKAIDLALFNGNHLFQVTQSLNVYCYYAYGAGQLVQAWVCSGLAIQFATPLGLNQIERCQEHLDRTKPKPRSLLPAPRSVVEKYQRWSTACNLRIRYHHITPAKPGTSQATTEAVHLTTNPLSISHPHFFSSHPYDFDHFQLELKATILLGRVSDWLIRAPDPVGFNLQKYWKMPDVPIPDLRSQADFLLLDQDITTFQMSLPAKYHQTIFEGEGRKVSHSKVMTLLIINLSVILLHECFLTKESFNLSFERCLQAASKIKWIGDLLFGSGYDCRLLHPFSNYCWAIAVRVMMRQLVQNEIKLIELATATTSPNQEFSTNPLDPSRTELDKNELLGLLKVEEEKVKQNLMEIESLLVFNHKTQNPHSKLNLNFNHHTPHAGQQQQQQPIQSLRIQQQSFHEGPRQEPPLQPPPLYQQALHQQALQQHQVLQHSIDDQQFTKVQPNWSGASLTDQYHQSAYLNDHYQSIPQDEVLNPMAAYDLSSRDIRYTPQAPHLGGNTTHLDMGTNPQPFDQPYLAQTLDQPVTDHIPENIPGTWPEPDHLDRDTTQPASESSPVEEPSLNQVYFDQLIVLFRIRFQAFRLPESLSRVVF
ncbi:hypothetical protein PCASD_00959 [Puccinia coronata f. sp. avenae]|uniref:Zn(2)-C6 fungal-type domain-containing protein n=1 Tax=Puccinia coronata f. sp. avenae TaxID=200324 RepID=A0A2N5VMW9_9BASI|nr:hypothetical protein PCASD_00959 [Puccinia coronata f. sp. avenae]